MPVTFDEEQQGAIGAPHAVQLPNLSSTGGSPRSVTFDDEGSQPHEDAPLGSRVKFDDGAPSNEDLYQRFETDYAKSGWQKAKEFPGQALAAGKEIIQPFTSGSPEELGEASTAAGFGKRLVKTFGNLKARALQEGIDFPANIVMHKAERLYNDPAGELLTTIGGPLLNYLGTAKKTSEQAKQEAWQKFQQDYFRKQAEEQQAAQEPSSLTQALTVNPLEKLIAGDAQSLPQTERAGATIAQLAALEGLGGATAKAGRVLDTVTGAAKTDKALEAAGKAAQVVGKAGEYVGEIPEKVTGAAVKALLGEEAGAAAKKGAEVAGLASIPAALAEHSVGAVLDPLHLGKLKALSKVGQAVAGVGEVAEAMATAPKNSIWGRMKNVATNGDSPGWMKTLLANRIVKTGAEIGRAGAELAKGTATGAGIGALYGYGMDQSPEDIAASTGGGAVIGGGLHAAKLPGLNNRKILARAAGASADLLKQHLQEGVPPEALKPVGDDAWTMAAAIQQHPGLGGAKVRFVPPEQFNNLKMLDGSQLSDPGAGGLWDRERRTIWIRSDIKDIPGTVLHEVAHPIFDAAILRHPELKRAIDQSLAERGQTIDDMKKTYIETLMQGQLDSMPDFQTQEAAIQNRIHAFDAAFPDNSWIYSEALAENFKNSFDSKKVLNLDPTVAGIFSDFVKNAFGGKENVKGFFHQYDNVVQSPALTKLSRGLLKSMRDYRPGLDILGGEGKGVELTPDMFGKRAEAPLHQMPDGSTGNDYVVATPAGIKMRAPSVVRKFVRDRVAAVRNLFDTKNVLPLGDPSPDMALRRTRAGNAEISGTRLPDSFYNLPVYSDDTKNIAHVAQDAIDNGKTLGSWYHKVASGMLGKTWARVAQQTKGAFTAEFHDYQPFGWKADKQGNVLLNVFDRKALNAKLADWANRKGIISLEQWGGDQGKAMEDIKTYLENHTKGLKGETTIGPDKANTINALLNGNAVTSEAGKNSLRGLLKGQDRQGIIRSLRLDRIETVEPSTQSELPRPQYEKLVSNFHPMAEADQAAARSPEEWAKIVGYKGPYGGGQTGWSFNLGSQVHTIEDLAHLRYLHEQARDQYRAAMKAGDMNLASSWASKSQAMREAYEAATDETFDGKPSGTKAFIEKHFGKGFETPMPEERRSPEATATELMQQAGMEHQAQQLFSPAGKKEDPHAVGGVLAAIHFSDAGTKLTTVDPAKMRVAHVGKFWEPKPKRSFFFIRGSEIGDRDAKWGNHTPYEAKIDGSKIYDATGDDPLGFFQSWPVATEQPIIDAGYKGVLMSANGGKDKVLISYEKVPVKPAKAGTFSPSEGPGYDRTVGYHRIMGNMRDEKWGDLPWGSPITHWTDAEVAKMDKELTRRSKSINQAGSFSPNEEEGPFYSQLSRVVDAKFSGKEMPAAQLAAILRNPQNGIKAEELKWTGLDDYLKGKGRVSKLEVQDYLKQNAVKVTEKTLGEDPDSVPGYDRPSTSEDTKFENYQLPGGENYRELLFQLPGAEPFEKWAERKGFDLEDEKQREEAEFVFRKTAPSNKEGQFTSSHWDEPNVLAHARINDRTDTEGKPGLFIEEIQSDWHQKGRKEGYSSAKDPTREEAEKLGYSIYKAKSNHGTDSYFINGPDTDRRVPNFGADSEQGAFDLLLKHLKSKSSEGVPDAPFKTTWHEMVLRRLVKQAAEEGKDWVGWTTGEQQAERYDLSKQVNSVSYNGPVDDYTGKGPQQYGLRVEGKNGETIHEKAYTAAELPDVVGKELADKIVAGEGEPSNVELSNGDVQKMKKFSGLDLKVGGEGMKGFYDKMLVDYANKFGKKFGAKVEKRDVHNPDAKLQVVSHGDGDFIVNRPGRGDYLTPGFGWDKDKDSALLFSSIKVAKEQALKLGVVDVMAVHSLPITPEMRESVKQGVAMFSPEVDEKKVERLATRIPSLLNIQRKAGAVSPGITFSVAKGKPLKEGFAVSLYPDRSEQLPSTEDAGPAIAAFARKNWDLLHNADNNIGIWDDTKGSTGKIWLDVSAVVPDRALAEYAGKQYNQAGIGDLSLYAQGKDGTIPTGGSGEAVPNMPPAGERLSTIRSDYQKSLEPPLPAATDKSPISSVDIYDNPVRQSGDEESMFETAKYFSDRTREINGGKDLSERTPENRHKLALALADEASHAVKQTSNALGWYDSEIKAAMANVAKIHPELVDEPARGAFYRALVAITSNGQSVEHQFYRADDLYNMFKKTGKIETDSEWGGSTAPSINLGLTRLMTMVDSVGPEKTAEFLNKEFTVRELDKLGFKIAGEMKDQKVKGSMIFGPKIGAFFSNLNGDFSPVTMDRWFMRTFNRLTGTLTGINLDTLPDHIKNFIAAIKNDRDTVAVRADGYRMLREVKNGTFDLDKELKSSTFLDYALGKFRDYENDRFRDRNRVNITAKNLHDNFYLLRESPRSGGERQWIRSTVADAQKILKARGINIENADLQAALWYYEKDLYAKHGIKGKMAAPASYRGVSERLLAERGPDSVREGQPAPEPGAGERPNEADDTGVAVEAAPATENEPF